MSESKNWRDHDNGMTVHERLKAMAELGYDVTGVMCEIAKVSSVAAAFGRDRRIAELEALLAGVSGQLQTLVSEIGESDYAMALIRVGDLKAERDRLRAALEDVRDLIRRPYNVSCQSGVIKNCQCADCVYSRISKVLTGEGGARLTRVPQRTKFDCLTACLATITGKPYEDCPQLWEFVGAEWLARLRDWCQSNSLGLIYFNCDDMDAMPVLDGVRLIACGKTPRSDTYDHAVVANAVHADGRTSIVFEFDPAGENFIESLEYILVITGARWASSPRAETALGEVTP